MRFFLTTTFLILTGTSKVLAAKDIIDLDERQKSKNLFTAKVLSISKFFKVKKSRSYCSAFLISNSCLLSAGHCHNSQLRYIQFESSSPYDNPRNNIYKVNLKSISHKYQRYSIYRKSGVHDWAVFSVQRNKHTRLFPGERQGGYWRISDLHPNPGDVIQVIGYPIDKKGQQVKSYGKVIRPNNESPKSRTLFHNADTNGGSSGSPIILGHTGEVVGIHTDGIHDGAKIKANKGLIISKTPKLKEAIKKCIKSEK